jgi:hypothetical protein
MIGGVTRLSHKQNSSREPNRGSKQDKFLQGGPPFETCDYYRSKGTVAQLTERFP